ncbi:MAG: hypothetical protein ACI9WU_001147 [Myxococcota bacterium]|jgi:hypothetical protein
MPNVANDAIRPTIDGTLGQAAQLLRSGQLDEAAAAYESVRVRAPNRFEGHLGLAQVLYQRRNMPALIQVLPMAVQAQPTCMPAYEIFYTLGTVGGVSDVAIQWLEHGAAAMPAEPVIFEWLIALYAMSGRDADLRQCLGHYARLRDKSVAEVAVIFARAGGLAEDVRGRIATAAGY